MIIDTDPFDGYFHSISSRSVSLTRAVTFRLIPSSPSSLSVSFDADPNVMHCSISQHLDDPDRNSIDNVDHSLTIFDCVPVRPDPVRVWLFVSQWPRFLVRTASSSNPVVRRRTSTIGSWFDWCAANLKTKAKLNTCDLQRVSISNAEKNRWKSFIQCIKITKYENNESSTSFSVGARMD